MFLAIRFPRAVIDEHTLASHPSRAENTHTREARYLIIWILIHAFEASDNDGRLRCALGGVFCIYRGLKNVVVVGSNREKAHFHIPTCADCKVRLIAFAGDARGSALARDRREGRRRPNISFTRWEAPVFEKDEGRKSLPTCLPCASPDFCKSSCVKKARSPHPPKSRR